MPARAVRRLATWLVTALAVAACSVAPPTPTPRPSLSDEELLDEYREIAEQVSAIRGLEDEDHSEPTILDRETLRENLEAEFDESNPPEQLQIADRIYRALGLIPEEESIGELALDLQASQVVGYYDPSVDELFIVSGTGELGPTERVTYAHEFTHELQDGAFDLESLGLEEAAVDEGDRALAILSLVEGDAVGAQTIWMAEHLTPEDLTQVATDAADPQMLDVLARTPAIILETALFPYQTGATFVQVLHTEGGYDAVNAAYDDPPESTEQIIHPELYLARERPIEVELPADLASSAGEGWTVDAQDTLGELQLRVWLREAGIRGDHAREAAAGWGGDRLGLLGGPGGEDLVVVLTKWDTIRDARIFADASNTAREEASVSVELFIDGDLVSLVFGDALSRAELQGLARALVLG